MKNYIFKNNKMIIFAFVTVPYQEITILRKFKSFTDILITKKMLNVVKELVHIIYSISCARTMLF